MMLRYMLIAILMLPALPAGAGEQVQHIGHDEPLEQAIGKSALHSLLNQALDTTSRSKPIYSPMKTPETDKAISNSNSTRTENRSPMTT